MNTFSVFTRTNSGIEYPVKNLFNSQMSAEKWIQKHKYDQTANPYYSPEGALVSLKYLNGLFVKPVNGMIERRKGATKTGKTVNIEVYPWESKTEAMTRINHTPYYDFQLTTLY